MKVLIEGGVVTTVEFGNDLAEFTDYGTKWFWWSGLRYRPGM